ncbi:MAG: hypothetical protein AB7K41_13975, partial [Bdellovibrionales bacterium]
MGKKVYSLQMLTRRLGVLLLLLVHTWAWAQNPPPQLFAQTSVTNRNLDGNDEKSAPKPALNNFSNVSQNDPKNLLEYKWQPMAVLDLDFSRNRITNLTPQESKPQDIQRLVTYDFLPERESLVFGDYRNGFRVVSLSRIDLGHGHLSYKKVRDFTDLNSNLNALVGLLPVVGGEALNVRYVKTLQQARHIKESIRPPQSIREFDSWAVGDSLMIAKRGGVLFLFGIGMNSVGASALSLARGEWTIHHEKINSRQILVKISNASLTDWAFSTGAGLVNMSQTSFDNSDENFSFVLDLSHSSAETNYQALASGDIAFAQERAASGFNGIDFSEKNNEVQTGTYTNFFMGVPLLLNTQWSRGHIETYSHRNLRWADRKIDVNYGVYSNHRRHRAFGTRRARQQVFFGSAYSAENPQLGFEHGYFGKYFWEFADNNSNHWQLRMAGKELIRRTGLRQAALNIPTREDLEYTTLRFEISFDQPLVDRWIKASLDLSQDQFVALGARLAESYARRLTEA